MRFIDLTVIVVSLVIGMGIFRTPVEVASKAGTPTIFLAAWIAGAVVSSIGALIFAEIGSRYPHAGGFYKIFSHCYHPAFAFMVNFITLISNAASAALVAILGAEYLAPVLFPSMNPSMATTFVAVISVLLLYGINMLGIRISTRFLSVLMSVKVLFLCMIIGGLFFAGHSGATPTIAAIPSEHNSVSAFMLCFIPVFFTFGGYQLTVNFGGDATKANSVMPKAIIAGMALVTVIYLLVNYAYLKILGFGALQQTTTLASEVAGKLFGSGIAPLVSIIMFLSVLAYVNVSVMSNPRTYYAMAEDGVVPKVFMRVHPRTQVQQVALTVFVSIILLTLFFSNSFENLLKFVMFFDSIAFMTAAAAIFIFRRRHRKDSEERVFRMKGYPWLPVLFILVYASITVTTFIQYPTTAFVGFLIFLLCYPLFLIFQYFNRRHEH